MLSQTVFMIFVVFQLIKSVDCPRELEAIDRCRDRLYFKDAEADHRRLQRLERTGDHTTRTGDSTTGTGYRTTGTAGTRWRSCTARAARGGW
ncbi:hypothetical protein Tco_1335775 [Tanacetum coccineum]